MGDVITTEYTKFKNRASCGRQRKINCYNQKSWFSKRGCRCKARSFFSRQCIGCKNNRIRFKTRKIKLSVKAAQLDEEKSLIAKFGEGATKSGATLKGILKKLLVEKEKKKKIIVKTRTN